MESSGYSRIESHLPMSIVGVFDEIPESDPTGRKASDRGSKLDAGKTPVFRGAFQYFPRALAAVANVSDVGAKKYTWKGWEEVPDGINRYSDALGRHIISESTEGLYDSQTGLLHAAQIAWNALARLELIIRGLENELQKS